MRPDLTTWRPVGDSVAARLRSCPAELLLEWEAALVGLRRQYWEDDRGLKRCVLCECTKSVTGVGTLCSLCPWKTFEYRTCVSARPSFDRRTPLRRIIEIGRWLKRIRAELKARGI